MPETGSFHFPKATQLLTFYLQRLNEVTNLRGNNFDVWSGGVTDVGRALLPTLVNSDEIATDNHDFLPGIPGQALNAAFLSTFFVQEDLRIRGSGFGCLRIANNSVNLETITIALLKETATTLTEFHRKTFTIGAGGWAPVVRAQASFFIHLDSIPATLFTPTDRLVVNFIMGPQGGVWPVGAPEFEIRCTRNRAESYVMLPIVES